MKWTDADAAAWRDGQADPAVAAHLDELDRAGDERLAAAVARLEQADDALAAWTVPVDEERFARIRAAAVTDAATFLQQGAVAPADPAAVPDATAADDPVPTPGLLQRLGLAGGALQWPRLATGLAGVVAIVAVGAIAMSSGMFGTGASDTDVASDSFAAGDAEEQAVEEALDRDAAAAEPSMTAEGDGAGADAEAEAPADDEIGTAAGSITAGDVEPVQAWVDEVRASAAVIADDQRGAVVVTADPLPPAAVPGGHVLATDQTRNRIEADSGSQSEPTESAARPEGRLADVDADALLACLADQPDVTLGEATVVIVAPSDSTDQAPLVPAVLNDGHLHILEPTTCDLPGN